MIKTNTQRQNNQNIRGVCRDWTFDDAPPVFYRRRQQAVKKRILSVSRPRKPRFSFPSLPWRGIFKCFGLIALVLLCCWAARSLYSWYLTDKFQYTAATTQPQLLANQTLSPELSLEKPTQVVFLARGGDTVSNISKRFGFSAAFNDKVQDALSEKVNIKDKKFRLIPGQRFEFNLSPQGSFRSLVFTSKEGTRLLVQSNDEGRLSVKQTELPKLERERIAVGVINSSFADAASRSGVSYDVIDDMVDLFSHRVEFNKDLQPGDRFTLFLSGREIEEGTALQDSVILAVALSVNGKQMMAVRFVGTDGKARYFDENGELIGDAFLRYPLKFSHISSYFSYARFHPILQEFRPHLGIDFAATTGTPVRTVADGVVKKSGYQGASGMMIEIQHGPRYSTNYLHLSKINSEVRPGARVTRGQIIGAVGNTGRSTGPHLHYGFFDNGKYIDPLKIKLPMMDDLGKGTRIDKRYLEKVAFTLQHYQSMKSSKPDWYK